MEKQKDMELREVSRQQPTGNSAHEESVLPAPCERDDRATLGLQMRPQPWPTRCARQWHLTKQVPGHENCEDTSAFVVVFYICFIYLAASSLSCGMQDLGYRV